MSKSIQEGQIAMVCELCETNPKQEWKCLQCNLMMCQRCRDKVHSKFASAEDHTIIDIKDISKHQEEQKLDFTRLKCTEHAGQKFCLYCKLCEEPVCPVCVAKTHNNHEMTEISDGYQIEVKKIGKRQKEINEELKSVFVRQAELRKVTFLEQSSYNKSKQGILDYRKSLVELIEKHCDKLLSELDQKWNTIYKSFDEADKRLKRTEKGLMTQNDAMNEALNSKDSLEVFLPSSLIKTKNTIDELDQTIFDQIPEFVPGDLSKFLLLHGRLNPVTAPFNTDLKINKRFTTQYNYITKIALCKDESFWISDFTLGIVQRVKEADSKIKEISNIKMCALSIALTPSGDLLLRVSGTSVIKVIPSDTEEVKDSPYNVSPLEPGGIHATQDNKIIIGAVDTDSSQVIILDQSGRQEKVFQYDKHKQALFNFPFKLTSTSNNNIGVVDRLSDDHQWRIVTLNNEGEIINIYTGHPNVKNEDNPFKPFDITTTPSDNFIISDPLNNTLHILSSNGEMITYYNTKELGIELPFSLSFNQTGQLYIGCRTYNNSEKKAKIYKLDNFVW